MKTAEQYRVLERERDALLRERDSLLRRQAEMLELLTRGPEVAQPEPEPASNGQLLEADEVAKLLNVPKAAVYRLAREHGEKFGAVKLGRLVRFDPVLLERWRRAGGAG